MTMVDITDYGAKGDGITDDAPAIRKAVNWNIFETVATEPSPAGTRNISVAVVPEFAKNASIISYVINMTTHEAFTVSTKVAPGSVSGGRLTLSLPVKGRGVQEGDVIRFSPESRGTIFFPRTANRYLVKSPIHLHHGNPSDMAPNVNLSYGGSSPMSFCLLGEGEGSYIEGKLPGAFVLDRAPAYKTAHGIKVVEKLYVRNTATTGGAIRLSATIGASLQDLHVTGHKGLICSQSTGAAFFTVTQGGMGYVVGDILTLVGGTVIRPITLVVATVDANGSIALGNIDHGQGVLPLDSGDYSALPPGSGGSAIMPAVGGSGAGAWFNIYFGGSNQSLEIRNIVAHRGSAVLENSCAVCVGANARVAAVDASGWHRAIAAYGVGVNMDNCRLEVNQTAYALGVDDIGTRVSLAGFNIRGGSCESNGTAIDCEGGTGHGTISGMYILGNKGAAMGGTNPQYGIRYRGGAANHILTSGMTVGSNFDKAAIWIDDNATSSNLVFAAMRAGCNAPGVPWRLPETAHTARFIECRDQTNYKWIVPNYKFSKLPTKECEIGVEYDISDGQKAGGGAAMWGEPVQGGGTERLRVRWNGSAWTCVAK
jgi:hypothetical protein